MKTILSIILKNEILKTIFIVLGILLLGCEKSDTETLERVDYLNVELDCINRVSAGATMTIRIDTQEEYDTLYYYKFTKPLEDWLNINYDALVSGVIRNYPYATPDQYDSIIINDYVYNFSPFKWTKGCDNPSIDFEKYILLGQSCMVGGCSAPKFETKLYKDENNKALIFITKIDTFGSCEAGYAILDWILVDKLYNDYTIIYRIEENNID